ncbi:hypothetical protein CGMCC3_g380 [Colletotrichum fructicola]|nr:uncharacterized protein CGMCC3_g380 [Colletotrichum fructicola]KAE9583726.1 hypothetical protein CGMCC3_g380 [Colletotrichum fructicola]
MKFLQVFALFATLAFAAPTNPQVQPELETRQCPYDNSKPLGGCA